MNNLLLTRRHSIVSGSEPPVSTPHVLGDIAYWDGSKLAYVPYTAWDSSLGTPVGICVIPTAHAEIWGNGKARFIAVSGVNSDGSASSTEQKLDWGRGTDTPLTNFTAGFRWSFRDSQIMSLENDNSFFVPTDYGTGKANPADPGTYFVGVAEYRPGPSIYDSSGGIYADTSGTSFYSSGSSGNAWSDLDGLSNTQTLAALGSNYIAFNATQAYSTQGIPVGQWYVPACGEMAYFATRANLLQTILTLIGGTAIVVDSHYHTSTEYNNSRNYAMHAITDGCELSSGNYKYGNYVRPWCQLI